MANGKTRSENRRLKQQLIIAQDELKTIKGSRTYKAIKLAGHLKNQVKSSPIGFTKKVINRIVSGTIKPSGLAMNSNLASQDDLQSRYYNWIALNEPDVTELEEQKIQSDKFKKQPLISIITPVFNPPAGVFKELIESVLDQTYPNFELCLGNFGDNEDIKDIISDYAKKDSRIRSLEFAENKGIAENSNMILSEARGEYIALLDHDDTLSRDALFENVKLINEDDYDFIYSDKDKIDESGKRFEPFFKPGWSPEIMLNANYLTHLNVMKTSVVKKVGAWDSSTDGAQDWDLFLKVVSASKKIGHIQKVLYHWRVIATSTAMSIDTKPYALEGQRRAVDKYLKENDIPAKSYHIGAELLLEWKPAKKATTCIVKSKSNTDLRSFISSLTTNNHLGKNVSIVVLHDYEIDESLKIKQKNISFIEYETGKYIKSLKKVLSDNKKDYILFFDDRLEFSFNEDDLRNLSGWLDIDNVLAAGPRLVDSKGYAIDCGAAITQDGVKPLFFNSPPYHQAAIGNIEWVRNMALVSQFMFMTRGDLAYDYLNGLSDKKMADDQVSAVMQMLMSKDGRLVFNPKVIVKAAEHAHIDVIDFYESLDSIMEVIDTKDPYINMNVSSEDPMKLTTVVHSLEAEEPIGDTNGTYQLEARAHAMARSITEAALSKNEESIRHNNSKRLESIKTAIVFLPDFSGIYAGLNNIFSFADKLLDDGVGITVGILSADTNFDRQRQLIKEKFPGLGEKAKIIAVSDHNVDTLGHNDLAVCTQWATAYILAKYNNTNRKCYFIQDKEASFYPKGTISALVENTYRFGFFALANTPGLLDWYKNEFGGNGVVIKSIVDLSKYSPAAEINIHPRAPYKVFFYARPNEPRNAFELGAEALVRVKRKLGKKVEIFAAGADWSPEEFGLEDTLTNLGKIDYSKLPSFYRSMDAGLMFMFSGHPGVVASELMASGCPVVVNEYYDTTWHELYQDEKTCLVSIPTADEVSRNIIRALQDTSLRKELISGGLDKVQEFYSNYSESIDTAKRVLTAPISN